MANDNTLNVEITSSVEGLKSGLLKAEKGVKGFSRETEKMTAKTNKMGKTVKTNAVPAMTSFSQVIQDAPFGIRGVANNITQLTSQMGYLSRSAGGTGKALKAMGATLMGPAGILLAVSVVTSLLVSYGDELANIGNGAAQAAEEQKKLVESLESTESVLKAQIGALNAQMKLLEAQGESAEHLRKEKLEILKLELKNVVAQRIGLSNQLTELKLASAQLSLWEKIDNLRSVALGGVVRNFAGIDADEQKAIDEVSASLSKADESIAKLQLSLGRLESPELFDTKDVGNIKERIIKPLNDVQPLLTNAASAIATTYDGLIPSEDLLTEQQKKVRDHLMMMEGLLNHFNEKAGQIISSGISNTFAGLGEAIGNALATGGSVLEAGGAALLAGLGSVLTQMGQMAITIGVGLIGIKKALQTLNPVAAIAAGVALIALGSFFSSKSKSIGDSIGGGGSDTDFSSGGRGTFTGSTASVSGGGGSGGTYVFEIAGTKLVGVLKNTLDRNRALGGSLSLTS